VGLNLTLELQYCYIAQDLDTASSLAILQEEIMSGLSTKEYKRLDTTRSYSKHSSVSTTSPAVAMEKIDTPKGKPDEKLAALMNYRRSKGLCFKCGGKWGPQQMSCQCTS